MCYYIVVRGDFTLRLRNLKNKEIILSESDYVIENPFLYRGRFCDLFGNFNPIHLEIGMGKGKFLYQNALLHPDINFIGIEKCDNVLARALLFLPKGIPNLKIIRIHALEIDKIFDKEISVLYLNFSDPWPKVRQNKRRLTSTIFLEKYENIFVNTKTIHFKTDNYDLYRYSIESLSQYGYSFYDVTFDLHREFDSIIMTEYEEKFVKKGQKIYALKARK